MTTTDTDTVTVPPQRSPEQAPDEEAPDEQTAAAVEALVGRIFEAALGSMDLFAIGAT